MDCKGCTYWNSVREECTDEDPRYQRWCRYNSAAQEDEIVIIPRKEIGMKAKSGLSTLTLFKAYRWAVEEREQIRSKRVYKFGIMVDTDPLAVEYQKRDRQARKLAIVLRVRFGDQVYRLEDICPRCAWYSSSCACGMRGGSNGRAL
jgi:hypothetical protein